MADEAGFQRTKSAVELQVKSAIFKIRRRLTLQREGESVRLSNNPKHTIEEGQRLVDD